MDLETSVQDGPSTSVRLSPNTNASSSGTATRSTSRNEPSVKKTAPKPKHTESKTKKSTVPKNKPKADKSASKPSIEVNKRLDRLEGMLENFISGFYAQEPPGEIQLPDPNHEHTRNTASVTVETTDQDTVVSEDNLPTVDITDQEAGTSEQNIGFASRFAAPNDAGENISSELANSLNFLISTKLEDKQLTDTYELYVKPGNCPSLTVPMVNPLIWDNISPRTRSMDLKIQRCQKPLIKALTALTVTLNNKELNSSEQDALALFSNSIFEMNMLRKELIKPELQQKFAHLCKPTVKPTQWLFGDNLPKTVKELEEEHKAVGVVKSPKGRYTQRFNPIRMTPQSQANRQRYQQAGWSRSQQRPFLGVRKYSNHYPSTQRGQAPTRNKGQTFKQTERRM